VRISDYTDNHLRSHGSSATSLHTRSHSQFYIYSTCQPRVAVINLQNTNASAALTAAAIWTAIIQFGMIIVGTFIIKRFSTSFSVGFLLGLVIVVAQQYLLLAVTFWHSNYGSWAKNVSFANLAFGLFILYSFFAVILLQFRESIMIAAVDAKGFGRKSPRKSDQASVAGGVNA
jgi:hypothetical protein